MINKKIIIPLIGITAAITVLLILYLQPTDYARIINQAEALMKKSDNVSINYEIIYDLFVNNTKLQGEGNANYTLINKTLYWNNTVSLLEGTFYSMPPQELIKYLKLSTVSEVIDYQSNISCNLINAFIVDAQLSNILMNDFDYVRIMACLNKKTGFPDQYTILASYYGEAVLVSYNSLRLKFEPKPFNESMIV